MHCRRLQAPAVFPASLGQYALLFWYCPSTMQSSLTTCQLHNLPTVIIHTFLRPTRGLMAVMNKPLLQPQVDTSLPAGTTLPAHHVSDTIAQPTAPIGQQVSRSKDEPPRCAWVVERQWCCVVCLHHRSHCCLMLFLKASRLQLPPKDHLTL